MFCRLIIWFEFIILVPYCVASYDEYYVAGEQQALNVQPAITWDGDGGYVMFCLCMGRFGNQAAHLLGSIAFAKALNRTLVLPPWRTYKNVPFTEWFLLEPITNYHKAVTMEHFMSQLSRDHWPPNKRYGYCRVPIDDSGCGLKQGSPFRLFWDEIGVDFVSSVYTGLSYDVHIPGVANDWLNKFPASQHPVIALRGAPARFPVLPHNRHLHKLLKWSELIVSLATDYIQTEMGGRAYIGLHLRMASDWQRACDHAVGHHSYMESLQCLEAFPDHVISSDICYPTKEIITNQTNQMLATHPHIKDLYIATDDVIVYQHLQLHFDLKVKVHLLNPERPQVDLVILARADHFIGSCVSSFTAFVKRERDTLGASSSFWGLHHVYKPYPNMLS